MVDEPQATFIVPLKPITVFPSVPLAASVSALIKFHAESSVKDLPIILKVNESPGARESRRILYGHLRTTP